MNVIIAISAKLSAKTGGLDSIVAHRSDAGPRVLMDNFQKMGYDKFIQKAGGYR